MEVVKPVQRLDMEDKFPEVTPKFERTYGASQFVNRFKLLMNGEFDNEIAATQGSPAAEREAKFTNMLLIKILEELRKLNDNSNKM